MQRVARNAFCNLVAWSIIPIHLKLNESLLDIPRQPPCMKLGTGGLYRPIQSYMCKQGSYMSLA